MRAKVSAARATEGRRKFAAMLRRARHHTVQGAGLSVTRPYFLMASVTFVAGSVPSSASALSAATVM